jgi:hypothetical protein
MTTTGSRMKPVRTKLGAAAAACALLTTAAMASAGAASASAAPARASSAALRAALHRDLSRYLTARRTAEHIPAVSLRVTFPGACGWNNGALSLPLIRRKTSSRGHLRLGPDCPA